MNPDPIPSPDAKALAVEALEHVQETIRSLLRNDASRRNLGTLYSRVNDESHRLKAALSALQTPAPQPEELRDRTVSREWLIEVIQQHTFAADAADTILAALLPSYRPPEGYAVVLADPDVAMMNALRGELAVGHLPAAVCRRAIRAVILAAPPPPSPEAQGEKL